MSYVISNISHIVRIYNTTETNGSGALISVIHQEVFSMMCEIICLWKVPAASDRIIVGATVQEHCARVIILECIRVLPRVAKHVRNVKRRITMRCMGRDVLRAGVDVAILLHRVVALLQVVTPWPQTSIFTLSSPLPFPTVGEAPFNPTAISTSLLQGNIRHWKIGDLRRWLR